MKSFILLVLSICSLLPIVATAQDYTILESSIRDNTTFPDLYYLERSEVPNSLIYLPPAPRVTDILFLNDRAQYEWGKLQRNTPRGAQAVRDAYIDGDGVVEAFSEAFGIAITREGTPEIYRLIQTIRGDAGDLATRDAKEHYMRVRPFNLYGEDSCTPEQQGMLSTDGSYPSGHTAIGWATALILAEINPDRQNEILKRGYEMGQSRVICGVHFQSDVDAGRIVASAVVARLHAKDSFIDQLQRAKQEFSYLRITNNRGPECR